MTQIASLLAVATILIGLWTLFTVREGQGLMCETKLPMQELELKVQEGGGGGIIVGFYGKTLILSGEVHLSLLPFTVWQIHMYTVEFRDYAPPPLCES